MSSSSIDPNSGFCHVTKTFHSLRPEIHLPPPSLPLSSAAFAFSSSAASSASHPAFIDSSTSASLSYPSLLSKILSLSSSLQTHYPLPPKTTAFILSPPSLHVPVLYLSLLRLNIQTPRHRHPDNPPRLPAFPLPPRIPRGRAPLGPAYRPVGPRGGAVLLRDHRQGEGRRAHPPEPHRLHGALR